MRPSIQLSEEEAKERGDQLLRLIDQDIRDRSQADAKRRRVRSLYFNETARATRYKGQSDIHLAVVTEKIEGSVPKISNAFWDIDPVIHAKRVAQEHMPEETDTVESLLNWAVDSGIPGFYETFLVWVRNMLIDGVSYLKLWYHYETQPSLTTHPVKLAWQPGDIDFSANEVRLPRPKTSLEILTEIFGGNLPVRGLEAVRAANKAETDDTLDLVGAQEALDGLAFNVDFIEGRVRYTDVRVEFHACRYIDEIIVFVFRPVVIADRVEAQVVEWEDMILPYRAKDLQTAERVTQQVWLTWDQIKQKRANENWDLTEDDMAFLKAQMYGVRQEEHQDNERLKDQKDDVTGVRDSGSAQVELEPFVDNKALFFEVYCRDEIPGSEETHEVIYYISYGLRKVLRAYYLEEACPHRRRPYATWRYITIGDRWYGISMADLLAPINLEVDSIINLVNDAQEIVNLPWFIYEPTSITVDPSVFARIEPGQGVPVADVEGIKFPQFPEQPLANLSALDSLLMFADRLTLSPQSVGSSQVRNAPRTARGTLALLSEAGVKNDLIIEQGQRGGWREMCHQMHALYEAFGPEEIWINVTGKGRPRRIRRKDLAGRYEYTFSGNSVNTNREVKRAIAQVRYNTLAADPLYATDLVARLALVTDFLHHFDEGTDITRLMPRLPGQGAPHLPFSQQEENTMLAAGVPVEVLPTDNHLEHLQEMERFQRTPAFEQLTQPQVVLFAWHKQQHMKAMLAQQAAGGTVPVGGTQANNVPSGVGQALGALEGGIQ